MIEVATSELRRGQVLTRSVYRNNGEIMLTSGFSLTDEVISKLRHMDQSSYWIQEDGLEDIIPNEMLPDYMINQAVEELRLNAEYFRQKVGLSTYKQTTQIYNPFAFMKDVSKFDDSLRAKRLSKVSHVLAKEIRQKKAPFILHLPSVRTQENYLFQHAVDSALVSAVLGRIFTYSDDEIEKLILGVMLMDFGYFVLPGNLAMKSGRLSMEEFKLMKEHPSFGFEIIRNNSSIPLICSHVAFQHHERQDGGGYPRRLFGTNLAPLKTEVKDKRHILRYAEIAAVADTYVNLIHPRPGELVRTPVEAIKFLLKAANTHLNATIVDAIIPLIPLFSVGSRVQIVSSQDDFLIGCQAVICENNDDRPQIILIRDAEGEKIKPQRLNLNERRDIAVLQIPVQSR